MEGISDSDYLADAALLPHQLDRTNHHYDPELELYRAVLRSAAEDLGHPNTAIRADAYRWFQDTHCGSPLSLCDVCRVLDLNPRKISRHALRWAGLR